METQKKDSLFKVAVAVLNWNGRKLLEQFLPKVEEFSSEADIYLIDNGSDDDSIPYVELHHPGIKIIRNGINYGPSEGYNEGLRGIKADIYCLLSSDVEVTEYWLNPIIEIFSKYPEIAAIQPKILDQRRRDHFEYAGAAGGFIDNRGYPYCRGRLFDTIESDKGQYDDTSETLWCIGACLFVKSKMFWEVGGFDAGFFAYMEEVDLCWRLRNTGYKIYYTAQSVVYHLGGGTLNPKSATRIFRMFSHNLLMLVKNLPVKALLMVLLTRLLLDVSAGITFFFMKSPRHAWAVVRAHFYFYKNFSTYYKKRTRYPIKDYYHHKNIVFQYFILGRKDFRTLK
ncbi:MAG: glycosyltransferase family 2 protein [Flavobacteriales bacterium Tduv]